MTSFLKLTSVLTTLGTLFCLPAVAQSRFCVGGDLDHLTPAQKASCNATLQTVRSMVGSLHAPDNWHYVVVCGEDGWKSYASFNLGQEDTLLNASADTNLLQHETYFRQSSLEQADTQSMQRAVAHEIAGILLHSKDEAAISSAAAKLIATREVHPGL